MAVRCPTLSGVAVVGGDAPLVGALSCAFARRGEYLCVLDGPRMGRDDADNEVIRRTNALARSGAQRFLLAGLPGDALAAIIPKLPARRTTMVTWDDVPAIAESAGKRDAPTLAWGSDRLGLGVLAAMYAGKLIGFGEGSSPTAAIPSRSGHLVVCEAGEPLSEVVAANYAFSLGAGLHIINPTDEVERRQLLEAYHGIDGPGVDAPAERARLMRRLRELVGPIEVPEGGSVTFVTRQLPFGAAFPERPSTHLFSYPDLGIAVVNGFAAEQRGARGTNVAVLVDPEKVRAPEVEAASRLLPRRGMFVRGYSGPGASVRAVSELVDLFPYDVLLFATHCGDAAGWRWTYQFRDSEGLDRTLVADVAIGVGKSDDPDLLQIMQFKRFHSLDGVDWTDPVAKAGLHVGTAMRDWADLERAGAIEPVSREPIGRVLGSAAMAMHDHNYLAMPRSLACEGTPVVVNNACVSWHELASRFMFANARAYVGTLFAVSDAEAEDVVTGLLGKHFGKLLPHAIWATQNDVYGRGGDRRPYVMTGTYPQRLRVTREDASARILGELLRAKVHWADRTREALDTGTPMPRGIEEIATFYDREAAAFANRWRRSRAPSDGERKP